MAEFVGIDPAGARRLISSMGDAVQRAGILRSSLSASIAEAGPDWPAGPGAEVLERLGRFLDEARRDLTWRTQTIERVEGAVPVDGVVTARFAFRDAASAQLAGTIAGARIRAALRDYETDPSLAHWEKVQATLRDGQGKTADPAYSTALLTSLGTTAFGEIFAAAGKQHQNDPRGYSPQNLDEVKRDLGPLAETFAVADAAGTLPRGLRDHALGDLPIGDMAALLGLAHQSREFLLQAGAKLLQYGGSRVSGKDWNTYWLAKALSQDVGATQRLLADSDNAALLLRSEVVNGLEDTDFEKLLAAALDKALAPGAGDAALRRDSWINIIDLFSRKNFWPSLTPGPGKGEWLSASAPSPIGQVLATHVSQYFPELIAVWNRGNKLPGSGVSAGWQRLDSERISRFFGGLLQGAGTLSPLKNGYGEFLRKIDLGESHPFGDAPTEEARKVQREIFYGKVVESGALASMLFNGLHEADLSAEQKDKIIAEFLVLPLDVFTAGAVGDMIHSGVIKETLIGKAADIVGKNGLKDAIENLLDQGTPEEASGLIDVLVDAQTAAFEASRREHGQPPLGDSDLRQLRDLFYGRLEPVLKAALEARGG